MKKYKIQEMIDAGEIDVTKLNEDQQEDLELIKILSENFTKEDADARKLDIRIITGLESKSKKPAAKPKPTKKSPPKSKTPAKKTLAEADVDKAIDGVIGKTIYFQSDKGNWVKGKIVNIFPTHKKDLSSWKIEYYGPGGEKDWEMPLTSDALTIGQISELLNNETVKGYTLKQPNEYVITDFKKAIAEIDECRETAKTERAEQIAKSGKPPKKTTHTVFKDKTKSWAENIRKLAETEKPGDVELRKQIDAIISTAEAKIKKLLFG